MNIVKAQPNPSLFYKSFLEFDGANIISALAFDSRSLEHLLGDHFDTYFSDEYPIFYKNKYRRVGSDKNFYRNAIDNAIRFNQAKAIERIIGFICKY